MKKGFLFIALSLAAMLLCPGCGRDDDDQETTTNVPDTIDLSAPKYKHYDPVFDTLVCYPVGTIWEKGYSVDDFEHLYVRSRFEVVSDTLIDGKHYKRVKGEIVHFDIEHVPDEYKGEKVDIFPGLERVLDPLDFYLYEDKGVVIAYNIDPTTRRPSYILREYDFNWPPYIHGLLFYSDGNIIDAEIPRSNITLLDGNSYEMEDYRVITRLMNEKPGFRDLRNAFLVKTIGCIYAMFGEYCDYWLKSRLLSFHRNGELLYEYGKVELPEKKRDDHYPPQMEKAPDLIGTWTMMEYNDSYHFRTTEINEGSIEWAISYDGVLYVNCDSTIVHPPFLKKGKYWLCSVTERDFYIDGYSYLYNLIDGSLTVYKSEEYGSQSKRYGSSCTFKKKQ